MTRRVIAWVMLISGLLGLGITFPMWILGMISDRTMLGITLALSWLALLYEGFNAVAIQEEK